jgi:hypothetical protein
MAGPDPPGIEASAENVGDISAFQPGPPSWHESEAQTFPLLRMGKQNSVLAKYLRYVAHLPGRMRNFGGGEHEKSKYQLLPHVHTWDPIHYTPTFFIFFKKTKSGSIKTRLDA